MLNTITNKLTAIIIVLIAFIVPFQIMMRRQRGCHRPARLYRTASSDRKERG
jgi:hypothetical protein